MAGTKDWAAVTCIRAHHPGCQQEGDQQHGWLGGPRPGQLGPGITHFRQLATAVLKGAHQGCVHGSTVSVQGDSYIRGLSPEGGAPEHVVSWLKLFLEPLSTEGLPEIHRKSLFWSLGGKKPS
jgi:hypothetical protein